MSNKSLVFLVSTVLISIACLFGINYLGNNWTASSDKYLSPNDVRGMAVEHHGLLYTLSFHQQNQVIGILNRSVKIAPPSSPESDEGPFGYKHLIVYRFNNKDLYIRPISTVNQQLLFKVDEWNEKGLMWQTDPGNLNSILSTSYDP